MTTGNRLSFLSYLTIIKLGDTMKQCPKCWNEVKLTDTVCPYCKEKLNRSYEYEAELTDRSAYENDKNLYVYALPFLIKKGLTTKGVSSRFEYFMGLFYLSIIFVLCAIYIRPILPIFYLMIIPIINATTRRLHDSNRNSKDYLILLIPLMGIIFFFTYLVAETNIHSKYRDHIKK